MDQEETIQSGEKEKDTELNFPDIKTYSSACTGKDKQISGAKDSINLYETLSYDWGDVIIKWGERWPSQ